MRYDVKDGYFYDDKDVIFGEVIPLDIEGQNFPSLNEEIGRRINDPEEYLEFVRWCARECWCRPSRQDCPGCRARMLLKKRETNGTGS